MTLLLTLMQDFQPQEIWMLKSTLLREIMKFLLLDIGSPENTIMT